MTKHNIDPFSNPPTDTIKLIKVAAIKMAQGAGEIIMDNFGKDFKTTYKDVQKSDPVTEVDNKVQDFIVKSIADSFPEHGIIGEEDKIPLKGKVPDYTWVLDPLDGTKNFLNGLPIFASSIGVLHRGIPIVGSIFVPWPGKANGSIFHASSGGGAYVDEQELYLGKPIGQRNDRLITLPGSFHDKYQFIKNNFSGGELRIAGSIAYEMAMTASGSLSYSLIASPYIWDVVAGSILIKEAGGTVLIGQSNTTTSVLKPNNLYWKTFDSFWPNWDKKRPYFTSIRSWRSPLIVGNPDISLSIANNLLSSTKTNDRLINALSKKIKSVFTRHAK